MTIEVKHITRHAIKRYRSRACPDATFSQAEQRLLDMTNHARYDGKAQGGALRYRWGDIMLIVNEEGKVLITLYWKNLRIRDREKVPIEKMVNRKRQFQN